MSLPVTDRVVEVLRDRGANAAPRRWTAGSGFLIGGQLVLTAAHCVDYRTTFPPDESVQVRLLDGQKIPATVVLAADEDSPMDLALLRLSGAPAERELAFVPFAEINRATPVPVTGCWAIGFPGFAEAEPVLPSGSRRESWHVVGTVLPGGKLRAGLLVLEVTGGPRPPRDDRARLPWSGMSGAVVFAPGPAGDHAIGVVAVHHQPEGERALTVVPVTALAGLPGGEVWREQLLAGRLPVLPSPSAATERRSRLSGELALREHWDPRGRGVERAAQPGSFFTGRQQALSELVAWLSADPDPTDNVRVITGGPGSGKSALLARLVVAADPRRPAVPADDPVAGLRPSAIDVAVHARAARTVEVVDAIAAAAGVPHIDRAELVDHLPRYGFTIALDALDEADNPLSLARELRRLAGDGMDAGVRVLVATRRGGPDRRLLTALGTFARQRDRALIDLDVPRYLSRDDLAEYVRRRLLLLGVDPRPGRRDTPYRGRDELAVAVANRIASAAYPAFLIGQLVSRSLMLRSSPVGPDDPQWVSFPTTVAAAMDQYLVSLGSRAAQDRVEDLLRPLAYARGPGLPLDGTALWPRLATALARPGREYTMRDVDELLETAADYLIETVITGGSSYYRLYHQALSDRLVELDRQQTRPVDSANLLVACLLSTVPRGSDGGRDWQRAHPYLLDQLAAHALDAGRLEELLDDPGFLVVAGPSGLFSTLQRLDGPPVDSGRVYQQAYVHLDAGADHAADRASYLQLAAERNGYALAGRLAGLPLSRSWAPRWVRGPRPDPNYVAGHHDDAVNAITVGVWQGRPVIVSAGDDETIGVWDLWDGEPVMEPLTGHNGGVNAVTVSERQGRPVIVSASFDETIRVWDLATGDTVAAPFIGHEGSVNAVTVAARQQRRVVVSGSADATVRLWDLESGQQIGVPFTGHTGAVYAVTVGERHGRPVVVSGSADHTLRLWDLESGEPIGTPLTGHSGPVYAVTVGDRDGKSIAVSAGTDEVRIWDIETGEQVGVPLTGHSGAVYTVALGWWRERRLIVSAGADQTIRVWDLASGRPLRSPLRGHDGEVVGVELGRRQDNPVLVSGGLDETVRVWDLDVDRPAAATRTSHTGGVNAVAAGVRDGQAIVVSGGYDWTVRLWDLASGDPLLEPFTGHTRDVMAVRIGDRSGLPVAVSGGIDGTIRVWDLSTGRLVLGPIAAHDAPVLAVGVSARAGRPVIVTGSGDATIRTWDMDGGAVGEPLTGHAGQVNALATGQRRGRPVVVSAGDDERVRVWELDQGRLALGPLTGHEAPVYALCVTELDGRPVVVSAGADESIRVWDLESGELAGPPLLGHQGVIRAVAAGTWHGRRVIASGSDDDRTVRVWDLGTHDAVMRPIELEHRVMAIDLAGDCMVIGTTGELVRIDLM